MTIELFLGVFSTLSVLIVGILQWRSTSQKSRSEALSINAETMKKLAEQIDELTKDNVMLHRRVTLLERRLRIAIGFIVEVAPENSEILKKIMDTDELKVYHKE